MSETCSIEEVVVLDRGDLEYVQEVAGELGVDAQVLRTSGMEPVSTVSVLLVGSALAVATFMRSLDQRKGGQVIDLRPGAPKPFYRTHDVVYGLVVVVSPDGKVLVDVKQPQDMFAEVIANLQELSVGLSELGSAAVTEQVREVLGDKAQVRCIPPTHSP